MPPSACAATLSDDDDDHHSHPTTDPQPEITDCDDGIDDQNEQDAEEEEEEEDPEEDGDDNGEEEDPEEDGDDNDEEVVVEEEEEDEEDMLDSSKKANEKDVSQYMVSDKQLESHSTPEISKPKLASNSVVEDNVRDFKSFAPSNEPLTIGEESNVNYEDSKYHKSVKPMFTARESATLESAVNKKDAEAPAMKSGSKDCSVPHIESKAHLSNMEAMAAETTDSSSITGKEVETALSKSYLGDKANIVWNSEEEVKPMDMQSDDAEVQTASRSRLFTSEIRTRSLSPSAEFKDVKKRPAVICDFFARGWCIRGSSCRFLHIKNKEDDTNQRLEGDEAATTLTRESQHDEGVRSIMVKPNLPCFPDLMRSSFGKDTGLSCRVSSERIIPPEHGASQTSHQLDGEQKFTSVPREYLSWCDPPNSKQFPESKGDPGFPSSFNDVGMENFGRNWPAADSDDHASLINRGSSPLFQKSLLPEQRYSLSGSVVMSSHYHSGNPSSYSSSLDDPACIKSTAWTGSSFSFSSSLHTNAFGSQKLLNSDRDYRAFRSSSLLRTASPFSGPEPENLAPIGAFGDQLCHAEHKTKFSSNGWEPSIPFRPSFFISPALISSPGSQYDPIRDSFDSPDIGDKSFKFFFLSQGTVLNSSLRPIDGDSISSRTEGTECDGDKGTISYHNRFDGNVLDKNISTPGKDSFTTGTVTGGTFVGDGKTEIAPKEESASGNYNDKDTPLTNKTNVDHDASYRGDVSRSKKGLKMDRVRQKNEMEVDQKMDGDVQKESKVIRHFRSSLVDFVKELLKPAWREGHLNKDAHNTIVKKAADKVLSTIRPHQIPTNMESIKQYISLSQPKITKLVEGYITKYGKS